MILKRALQVPAGSRLMSGLSVVVMMLFMTSPGWGIDVSLQWDPNSEPDLAGYRVYYGIATLDDPIVVDVGNTSSITISNLDPARTYLFAATAYTASGLESTYSRVVLVPETEAPTVSITSPAAGATVSGFYNVTATATDTTGVTRVQFLVNGNPVAEDTTFPYVFAWGTAGMPSGPCTLTAKASDAAGNVGVSAPVTVMVAKDATPPTVAVTAPASGKKVNGTVSVVAGATDNVGVSMVEFFVNGALRAAVNSAPYSFAWDTTKEASSCTLAAKAYDAAGNVGVSSLVTVTVENVATTLAGGVTSLVPVKKGGGSAKRR